MIIAPNNMGDAHFRIVNHHHKIVGGSSIGALDDQIIQLSNIKNHLPTQQVFDYH